MLIRSGEAPGIDWSRNMLYSGFNILPRSVFWSAYLNGRSDNTDVIRFLAMIFGNPNTFAIEVYHEPSGPRWAGFGRMCIHIEGNAVGDIRDNHCSLYHATSRFRELAGFPLSQWETKEQIFARQSIDSLWHDSFNGISEAKIFDLIDRALYVGDWDDSNPAYRNFDFLTNTGEMFDRTKTFIYLRPDGNVRFLCRMNDDSKIFAGCGLHKFQTAAKSYVSWFAKQIINVQPPYFPINPFDLTEVAPPEDNG